MKFGKKAIFRSSKSVKFYLISNKILGLDYKFIFAVKMSEILYLDAQITIYKELILIKKYYFPLATSRTILFSEIESVSLIDSEEVNHRWGVCRKYLNNWFPLDTERKNRTKFIELKVKGRKIRPSITPIDPEKVFQIIWENYTPEGKDYVQRMSERAGKQTEIAQQELMQRERDSLDVSQQELKVVKVGK